METKIGRLDYNYEARRLEINYGEGDYHELHCGDPVEIKNGGKWVPTRPELDFDKDEWYFVGLRNHEVCIGDDIRRSGDRRFG